MICVEIWDYVENFIRAKMALHHVVGRQFYINNVID